jgi:hypothetical protein
MGCGPVQDGLGRVARSRDDGPSLTPGLDSKILTLTFLRGKCDENIQIESGFDSHWSIYVGGADNSMYINT